MKYSKKTGGFYLTEIHGKNIPDDTVGITSEYHSELLNDQGHGKVIKSDTNGYPISVDIPPPSMEKLGSHIRYERNKRALCAFDAKEKYEREQASILRGISIPNPMPESDYVIVLQYLQDLFEMPQQSKFPWNGPNDPLCQWPTKPDCVRDISII